MKNTFGSAVSLTIFGESHGPAIGAVLDGLAAGLAVDPAYLALRMDRRRARGDGLSTARTEPDEIEFLSGVYNGRTTGTAVTLALRNTNTRSGDYAKTAALLRPGHADYTAFAKYEGWQDARGGGHFSGRLTAAAVAAGALCEHVLQTLGVRVYTHIAECAGIADAPLSSAAGLVRRNRSPATSRCSTPPGKPRCRRPSAPPGRTATVSAACWRRSSPASRPGGGTVV